MSSHRSSAACGESTTARSLFPLVLMHRKRLVALVLVAAFLAVNAAWAADSVRALRLNGNTDGTGAYVSVFDSDDLDVVANYTAEAWINWNGDPGYRVFLSSPAVDLDPVNVGTGWHLVVWDGQPCLGTITIPFQNRLVCQATPINANEWTHVAGSTDGQTIWLYVNGALVEQFNYGFFAAARSDSDFGTSTPLLIGREFENGLVERTFPGFIDEVRLWNTVLPPETIAAFYNNKANGAHPSYEDLLVYFQFNEPKGPTTRDVAKNEHTGFLTNDPERVRSTVPLVGIGQGQ